ncbi:energy transducer TonB [Sphingobium sp. AN641]|uniref:energy transducer TonB n=1 Tax=Sphingobium sp. AN641 TaxID=3133443 RepID=UPI0030C654C2
MVMARECGKSRRASIVSRHGWMMIAVALVASNLCGYGALAKSRAHGPIPRLSPGEWVRDGDYPVKAVLNKQAGATAFRLTVDAEGFTKSCIVTESSGNTLLDETACALMRARGYFLPQTDDAGQPMEGEWRSRIVWRLPGSDDGRTAPGEKEAVAAYEQEERAMEKLWNRMESFSSETHFTIQADGHMTDCEQRFIGAIAARFVPFRCGDMPPVSAAFKNADGAPVAKRVVITHGMSFEDIDAPPPESAASIDYPPPKP